MTLEFTGTIETISADLVRSALLYNEGKLFATAKMIEAQTGQSVSTNQLRVLIQEFDLEQLYIDLEADLEKRIEEELIDKIFDPQCKQSVSAAVTILRKKYGWKDVQNISVEKSTKSKVNVAKLSDEELNKLHELAKKINDIDSDG